MARSMRTVHILVKNNEKYIMTTLVQLTMPSKIICLQHIIEHIGGSKLAKINTLQIIKPRYLCENAIFLPKVIAVRVEVKFGVKISLQFVLLDVFAAWQNANENLRFLSI